MLNADVQRGFIKALLAVPATSTFKGRTSLLMGIPISVVAAISRDESSAMVDLNNIIAQLDELGRLVKTGERPLVILAENGLAQVEGTTAADALRNVLHNLEEHYGGDSPSETLPPAPEILVFEGRDERLAYSFISRALHYPT